MPITIDDTARFVSVLTFDLDSTNAEQITAEVQQAVEREDPHQQGFIGSVVMTSGEKTQLLVVSIWESAHAWSVAQYDREIGRIVSDVVEGAKSYDIQTYDTVRIVRAR